MRVTGQAVRGTHNAPARIPPRPSNRVPLENGVLLEFSRPPLIHGGVRGGYGGVGLGYAAELFTLFLHF